MRSEPSDDLNQPFDCNHMVKWAELFKRWTLDAANAERRPLWYAGDYFGERFALSAPKASAKVGGATRAPPMP